jgi:hypothetical protein
VATSTDTQHQGAIDGFTTVEDAMAAADRYVAARIDAARE